MHADLAFQMLAFCFSVLLPCVSILYVLPVFTLRAYRRPLSHTMLINILTRCPASHYLDLPYLLFARRCPRSSPWLSDSHSVGSGLFDSRSELLGSDMHGNLYDCLTVTPYV